MDGEKCLYSRSYGNKKDNKGTFLKFAEQTQTDDSGKIFQVTMAIVKEPDGNIIMVEPSCLKIID